MEKINYLCEKLNYTFKNSGLLEEALRHSSFANENKDLDLTDNERLEFLGDAVLDLAVSHILMEKFTDMKEGDLSKFRATIVNESGLYSVAVELGLGDFIFLGKGEELTNGREKPSILANAVESLIGAIYLDAGFEQAREIIEILFSSLIDRIKPHKSNDDYKSMLQEYTQNIFKILPEYSLIDEKGMPHDKTFKIALRIKGSVVAEGSGKSKKEAEQNAAREAYYCLLNQKETL